MFRHADSGVCRDAPAALLALRRRKGPKRAAAAVVEVAPGAGGGHPASDPDESADAALAPARPRGWFLDMLNRMLSGPHGEAIRWSDSGKDIVIVDEVRCVRCSLGLWFVAQVFVSLPRLIKDVRPLYVVGRDGKPVVSVNVSADCSSFYNHLRRYGKHRGCLLLPRWLFYSGRAPLAWQGFLG